MLTPRIAAHTASEARSMPRSRDACSITSGSGSSGRAIGTPSADSRAMRSCSIQSSSSFMLSPAPGISARPSSAARPYMLLLLPAIQLPPLSMLGPQGARSRTAPCRCAQADVEGSCSYSSSKCDKARTTAGLWLRQAMPARERTVRMSACVSWLGHEMESLSGPQPCACLPSAMKLNPSRPGYCQGFDRRLANRRTQALRGRDEMK